MSEVLATAPEEILAPLDRWDDRELDLWPVVRERWFRTCRKCGRRRPLGQFPATAFRGSFVCLRCIPMAKRLAHNDPGGYARDHARRERKMWERLIRNVMALERIRADRQTYGEPREESKGA